MTALLELQGVTVGYGGGDVLHDLSLVVEEGGITCIVGPNGAGKSTVLRLVSGLLHPRLGGVRFQPRKLPAKSASAFVAASIATMPVPFEAKIFVNGPAAAVSGLIRYANARAEAIDDATCRVLIRSDSRAWLVTVVALLATEFDIVVEEPADLLADLKKLGLRLRAVATGSAK